MTNLCLAKTITTSGYRIFGKLIARCVSINIIMFTAMGSILVDLFLCGPKKLNRQA